MFFCLQKDESFRYDFDKKQIRSYLCRILAFTFFTQSGTSLNNAADSEPYRDAIFFVSLHLGIKIEIYLKSVRKHGSRKKIPNL